MIKSRICPYLVPIALTVLLFATPGCATPHRIEGDSRSLAAEPHEAAPFLGKAAYSDQLGRVLYDVLPGHRFSIPWIVVRSPDKSLWFVAERFQSEHRFDRVYVHVTTDEHVTTRITGYQYGPSDWAILGTFFAGDFRIEAESIAAEITRRLSHEKDGVQR